MESTSILPISPISNPTDLAVSEFFEKYTNLPAIIEGPDFTIDRSYKWYCFGLIFVKDC